MPLVLEGWLSSSAFLLPPQASLAKGKGGGLVGSHQSPAHLSWTLPLAGQVVPGSAAYCSSPLGCCTDLTRSHLQSHWGLTLGPVNRSSPEAAVGGLGRTRPSFGVSFSYSKKLKSSILNMRRHWVAFLRSCGPSSPCSQCRQGWQECGSSLGCPPAHEAGCLGVAAEPARRGFLSGACGIGLASWLTFQLPPAGGDAVYVSLGRSEFGKMGE